MSLETLTPEHDECACGKVPDECDCECTCTQDDECGRCYTLNEALDQIASDEENG